jgi:hypothetical protein
MDTIAFTTVAEDLVEKTASEASQNMKIDASDHAVALDQALGKIRLFNIGMKPGYFSRFSINYVLKKSYPVDDQNLIKTLSATQVRPLYLFYIATCGDISFNKLTFLGLHEQKFTRPAISHQHKSFSEVSHLYIVFLYFEGPFFVH